MGAGRPPKYKTAVELQKKIDEYFNAIGDKKNILGTGNRGYIHNPKITISGLCYHLGFCSRQSFYDLQEKEEFTYTIKKARLRVFNHYEQMLQGNAVAGPIFALKNLGWSDRQEIDHTSKGEKLTPINITVDSSETAETLKKLRDGTEAN